jgi:hypothetical protein
VHDLTSTAGIVAIAAGAVAVVALGTSLFLALRLGRLRSEQRAVLGDRRQDLVAHAASLQSQFEALHGYVEDVAARLDGRMGTAEARLDGAIAHSSLIRYDAYGEMSGRQSISIALRRPRGAGAVSGGGRGDQDRAAGQPRRAASPAGRVGSDQHPLRACMRT